MNRKLLVSAGIIGILFTAVIPSHTSSATQERSSVQVRAVVSIWMTVSDMKRSVDFYSNALTFSRVSDVELEGPEHERLWGVFGLRMRVVRMRLGDELLVLTQYLTPSDGRPIPADSRSHDLWFQHIAVVVGDMDEAYERVSRHDVRFISTGPQTLPESNRPAAGIKAFKFLDPDGHPLELLWFPPGKGDTKWHRPTDKLFLGIDHTAIGVSDTERSLRFYRDLLGLRVAGGSLNVGTEQEHLDNVPGARVRVTALRPSQEPPGIEFLEYKTPTGGRPMPAGVGANDIVHWQTALLVDDVERAVERLRVAQVRFVSPGVSRFADDRLGFEKGVMVRDPDGHAMLLVEQAEASAGDRQSNWNPPSSPDDNLLTSIPAMAYGR